MGKTIITCAVNGATVHRGQCPTVPYTPAEIAGEAERAYEAGAAVVHVTAREDGGGPSYRVERYREVVNAIRDRCPVLVSVSTTAFGVALEERTAPLEARPDLAILPMGTMTHARYNTRQKAFDYDHVFANRFSDVITLATRARELSVATVASCYDLGHLASLRTLREMGGLLGPVRAQFVIGVTGGIAATPHSLCRLVDTARRIGDEEPWWQAVAANGSWRLHAAALSLGGHLRVGFQDGLHLPTGEAADGNAALVEAAVGLCGAVGSQHATVEEARELLGL